jgi:hypothetical protein
MFKRSMLISKREENFSNRKVFLTVFDHLKSLFDRRVKRPKNPIWVKVSFSFEKITKKPEKIIASNDQCPNFQ